MSFHIRNDCRLCGGQIERCLTLPDTALANEYVATQDERQDTFPLFLARCSSCQHVELPVIVDPERLFRDYAYRSSTAPSFVEHLKRFAQDVQPKPNGYGDELVVEIGSNDGTLLAEYARRGCRTMGIDPASNLAAIALRKYGIHTVIGFFTRDWAVENFVHYGNLADLIVANNVFAHADDIADIARGVKAMLAADGTFVFEVGYLPDMLERGLYRVIYHEHLSYHHLRPLVAFFDRLGLCLFDAHRVDTQGGSIRCFVAHSPAPRTGRLDRLLDAETPEALRVERLADRIKQDRLLIRAQLAEFKAEGKLVCGYGAPAQLTTLCAALGLTRDDIAFVVDDNPAKVGKFTPGTHIPIVAIDELYGPRAPYACVIFSANFKDEILDRHAAYAGEWVTL